MRTILLSLCLFSLAVQGAEREGSGKAESKDKPSLTKFERAVLEAPLIVFLKIDAIEEKKGEANTFQTSGKVGLLLKNVTKKMVKPHSRISVKFQNELGKEFAAGAKKRPTIFLLKPSGEAYVPVMLPDAPLFSRKDVMRIRTVLNENPPKGVPAHDCCHNQMCCGMAGCCTKTACINANCKRLKTP